MKAGFELEDLEFLQALLGPARPRAAGLDGPGDDCAVIPWSSGEVVACMDPVIEGRHFEPGEVPARVARKLVHRNFSDLAAMGAWPSRVLVSCCFHEAWTTRRRRAFYRALREAVESFGARWVGGDVAGIDGPAVHTLTALGDTCAGRVAPRSGLRVGDLLCVSGALGNSRSSGWHLDFVPRLEWGRRLVEKHAIRAMIDVSDGLVLDLRRMLAGSSDIGVELDASAVPRRRGASLEQALFEGEDHELLVAAPPRVVDGLGRDRQLPAQLARPLGKVVKGGGIRLRDEGRVRNITGRQGGWVHELGRTR